MIFWQTNSEIDKIADHVSSNFNRTRLIVDQRILVKSE